jgi:sugar phosphate isomerase/epimerase
MKKHLLLSVLLLATCVSWHLSSTAQISPGVCTSIQNAAKVKAAGGDYIELSVSGFLMPDRSDAEFADNLAAALSCPIPILICNSFFPGSIRLTGPDRDHDRALEYAETAFRRARQTGIRQFVLGSSGARNYPEGYDKQTAVAEFVDFLKRLGPVAAKYDVTVALEPLNKREANFMNTVAEGVDIVRRVGHDNVRCLADIYHMLMENEGPEVLTREIEYISHTHIAEREGRSVPGTHGEDLTPYYDALKKARYRGGMSIEARWDDFDGQLAGAIANMREHIEK